MADVPLWQDLTVWADRIEDGGGDTLLLRATVESLRDPVSRRVPTDAPKYGHGTGYGHGHGYGYGDGNGYGRNL